MGSINFANALGIHEDALRVRTHRTEILANNLANSDTPGFKARELDFRQVLLDRLENKEQARFKMTLSNVKHIQGYVEPDVDILYRTPTQASVDGNTVDEQLEHTSFMRNAMSHQASFQFLNGRFKGVVNALKGE